MNLLARHRPSTSSTASSYIERRPSTLHGKWDRFKLFIWDGEKKKLFNRTFGSWFKIILFYFIYVGFMIGMFVVVMYHALRYINESELPWVDKAELLEGDTPGVGFIPNILKINAPLVWYTSSEKKSSKNVKYEHYVDFLDQWFIKYDTAKKNMSEFQDCEKKIGGSDKPCIFNRNDLGPCASGKFGYDEKKPCIFLKMNKLPHWKPDYFKGDDIPSEMPIDLQDVIKRSSKKEKVWVHCTGVDYPDIEHLGNVTYYPDQGFNGYYFPYERQENYLTPLIAVKLNNVKEGYLVQMKCSMWAKNISLRDVRTHATYIMIYIALN